MRILILGATGRTGILLLQEALRSSYTVTVLVRDKNRVPAHASLTVLEGSTTDEAAMAEAMQGCSAILSTLNISRNSDFPWAKLRTPPDLLSKTAALVIKLAPQFNISRVIIFSAWGAGSSRQEIPWWFRWLIDNSNIGFAYDDQERQENLLARSMLNYTVLRPVALTNSRRRRAIIVSFYKRPKPSLTISRGDAARFMLSVLECNSYERQMPVIST